MKATFALAAMGLVTLGLASARADVEVRAPLVRVRTGPLIEVRAPLVRVVVPSDRIGNVDPRPEPLPPPRDAQPAWTIKDFAASFKPAPGYYEVVFLHPHTCRPVKVCFELPDCCLKEINVRRDSLEFDYGKVEVEVEFKRDGRVKVEYRD